MIPATEQNPLRLAIGQMRRTFILVGLFSAGVNILMLTGPMFMLQVYDRVLASGSFATLQGLFVIVVVLYAFLGLYDFLRTRLLSRAGYRLDRRRLRNLAELIQPQERKIVITDFEDEIGSGVEVKMPDVGSGVDKARFKMKMRRFVEDYRDQGRRAERNGEVS